MVYVLNVDGKPLMPCSNAIARLLLKDSNAKVKRRTPFTIKLTRGPKTEHLQELTLGIDTGSSIIGSAVVSKKKVVYRSEITIRNDITKKMDRRRNYRRTRRNRKCRYRKCRFLNRKNSTKKERLPPTIRSKIESHLREIKFVKSLLPLKEIILEGGSFDPHALKNPEVLKNPSLYQRGLMYGLNNVKAYILKRDNHTCQECKGKSKDKRLHCHHIIFKLDGGSDDVNNLMVLCKTCHDALHRGELTLKLKGIKKKLVHATQMNVILSHLFKILDCEKTFGFITKTNRQSLFLPKSHSNDAIMIASKGKKIEMGTTKVLYKKCIAKGDYQQTKGIRSEKKIPTRKIHGFRKFDKVKYRNNEYFIKGRMSSGYAILMNIHGMKQELKPTPKFNRMERLEGRTSCMIGY